MNTIQSTIVAAIVSLSITSTVFAAEADKPVVPEGPVMASQHPEADAAVKAKSATLRERNKRAKAATASVKKAGAEPASPAIKAAATKRSKRALERKARAEEPAKTLDSGVIK
jgi:hypothetical protein